MIKVRDYHNFAVGAIFASIGSAFAFASHGYPLGQLNDMGAGYFPMTLGIGLAGVGLALVVKSIAIDGPPVDTFSFRPMFWTAIAVVLFAFLLERFGLVAAVFVLVLVGARASRSFNWLSAGVLAIGLSIFSALAFGMFLGLPVPLFKF